MAALTLSRWAWALCQGAGGTLTMSTEDGVHRFLSRALVAGLVPFF